jgi:hypothetical protein
MMKGTMIERKEAEMGKEMKKRKGLCSSVGEVGISLY